MNEQVEAFLKEYIGLCKKHKVQIEADIADGQLYVDDGGVDYNISTVSSLWSVQVGWYTRKEGRRREVVTLDG